MKNTALTANNRKAIKPITDKSFNVNLVYKDFFSILIMKETFDIMIVRG